MRLIDAALITLTLIYSAPSLSGDYGAAADHARRALLQTEFGRGLSKQAERKGKYFLEEKLGMEKEDLIYFIWALPVTQGRISTRPFKNLAIKGEKWYLKPEIEYDFNGQVRGDLNLFVDF